MPPIPPMPPPGMGGTSFFWCSATMASVVIMRPAEHTRRRTVLRQDSDALLAGKLFDDRGNRMSPSHAAKGGRRYRYYVSQAILQGRKHRSPVCQRARLNSGSPMQYEAPLPYQTTGVRSGFPTDSEPPANRAQSSGERRRHLIRAKERTILLRICAPRLNASRLAGQRSRFGWPKLRPAILWTAP